MEGSRWALVGLKWRCNWILGGVGGTGGVGVVVPELRIWI